MLGYLSASTNHLHFETLRTVATSALNTWPLRRVTGANHLGWFNSPSACRFWQWNLKLVASGCQRLYSRHIPRSDFQVHIHQDQKRTVQRMKEICKETFLWQDGRLSPKSIYEIIAHTKFVKDISEKLGQRMYEAQILENQVECHHDVRLVPPKKIVYTWSSCCNGTGTVCCMQTCHSSLQSSRSFWRRSARWRSSGLFAAFDNLGKVHQDLQRTSKTCQWSQKHPCISNSDIQI